MHSRTIPPPGRARRPAARAATGLAAALLLLAASGIRPARADVIINGTNRGNTVNITDFFIDTLSTTQTETVGSTSNGTFNQGLGQNSATGAALVLGNDAGVTGTYNLFSGGPGFSGILSAATEAVGQSGTGLFNQSAGSNSVAGALGLGANAGAVGTYTLSGGTLAARVEMVGVNGTGTLTQTGGTNTVGPNDGGTTSFAGINVSNGDLAVGVSGSGTYNLRGGSLTATLNEILGTFNGSTGQFTQSGTSTNTVGGTLFVNFTGVSGSYDLRGGTLGANAVDVNNGGTFRFDGGSANFSTFSLATGGTVTASGNEVLASSGLYTASTFTETGGTNTVAGALVLGGPPGTTDTYDLQAGVLTAPTVQVNAGGTFKFDGGTANVRTYTLATGGAATAAGNEAIGAAGPYTTTSFTQTGGTNTVAGVLGLGAESGTTGIYTLNGGALSAKAELIGGSGTGTVTQTGGTNTIGPNDGGVSSFYAGSNGLISLRNGDLAVGGFGSGTYNLRGGSLTATANEFLGTFFGSVGQFTQSGTSTNTVGGTLVLAESAGTSGSYDLQGGTLGANAVQVNGGGTFHLEGGSVTAGAGGFNNAGLLSVSGAGGSIAGALTNTGTGTVQVSHTTASFTGSFTNAGAYHSASSTQNFATLDVTPTGFITAGAGDRFKVSGNFFNTSTLNTKWNTSQATLEFNGGGAQTLGLAGIDLGTVAAGYVDNFAWGGLQIDSGTTLSLLNERSSGAAALYVGDVLGADLFANNVFNIIGDGLNIYYDPFLTANAYLNDQTYQLADGGQLIADSSQPMPEPWSLALLLPGLAGLGWTAGRARACRRPDAPAPTKWVNDAPHDAAAPRRCPRPPGLAQP